MDTRIWPGEPAPLGATFDGVGTRFAVVSSIAEQVDLCLFDADGHEEHVQLPERTGDVWHVELPDVQPGQRYGYRVHGPWAPDQGLRCNPAKLLLDPTPRRSRERSGGTRRCSGTGGRTRSSSTTPTRRRSCPAAWS